MKQIISIFGASMLLGGCGIFNYIPTVDPSKDAEKKAGFLEEFQINTLFHNIMRSANGEPLTFMRIAGTTSSLYTSQTIEAGTTISGQPAPNSIFGSVDPVAVKDTAGGTNTSGFNVNILDDSEYRNFFLNPVPLEYMEFFVDNHRPKTLTYTLFIDQIKIKQKDGSEVFYNNNPLLNNYQDFQDKLYELITYGMEPLPSKISEFIGAPVNKSDIVKKYGPDYNRILRKEGISLLPIGTAEKLQYQLLRKFDTAARMCIPRKNVTENEVRDKFGSSIFCEISSNAEVALSERNDPRKTTLIFRSTSGIFDFLGEVAYSELNEPTYTVKLPPIGTQSQYRYPKFDKDTVLLNVKEVNFFTARSDDYAQIETRSGKKYVIPDKDVGYSKITLRILSQIIKLNEISGYANVQSPLIIQNGSNIVGRPYINPQPR